MAASTVVKNFTDGTILVADGTGTPLTHTDNFTQGNLTINGLSQTLNEIAKYECRGSFKSARHTNRTYPTGSFSLMMTDVSDATDSTLIDLLLAQNSRSAAVSTLGANAEVYAVDITLTIEGTDHGDSADHTFVMTDCVCTVDVAEGDPNVITVNFEVLGTVTMT
jgi:hypothetical protein